MVFFAVVVVFGKVSSTNSAILHTIFHPPTNSACRNTFSGLELSQRSKEKQS